MNDSMMIKTIFKIFFECRKDDFESAIMTWILRFLNDVTHLALATNHNERASHHVKIDAKAIDHFVWSKAQKFSQTVSVDEKINDCKVEERTHYSKRAEQRFKWTERDFVIVLIDEICPEVFWQNDRQRRRSSLRKNIYVVNQLCFFKSFYKLNTETWTKHERNMNEKWTKRERNMNETTTSQSCSIRHSTENILE